MPKILVIYDSTVQWYLAILFAIAARLYKVLGIIDEYYAADSWHSIPWENLSAGEDFNQIHYWGHGVPGGAYLNHVNLWNALADSPNLAASIKEVLSSYSGILWLRTCSSFQGSVGQAFASALSYHLNRIVVGHTYNIAIFQSGGHVLGKDKVPYWDTKEGADRQWSSYKAPNTIFCIQNSIPRKW